MRHIVFLMTGFFIIQQLPCFAGPIHDAVAEGNLPEVKKIITQYPETLNSTNYMSRTPLHIAAFKGHKEIVAFLIRAGADVSPRDIKNRKAPLHYAVRDGYIEIVKLLIEAGADVNVKNLYNWIPLHYASAFNRPEIADLLIEKGAHINFKNKMLWTPLHLAGYGGNNKIIKLLIENGADINAVDKNSEKPDLSRNDTMEIISTDPKLPAVLDIGERFNIKVKYNIKSVNKASILFFNEFDKGSVDDITWINTWPLKTKEGIASGGFRASAPLAVNYIELILFDEKKKERVLRKYFKADVRWQQKYPEIPRNPLFGLRTTVGIGKEIPEYKKIYDTLAKKGVKKFKMYEGSKPPIRITFDPEVPLKAVQLVLRACLSHTKNIASVKAVKSKYISKDIYIASTMYMSPTDNMPIEIIYKMASPAMTKYEFLKLAGYNYTRKKGEFGRVDADRLFTELGMKNDIMQAEYLFTPDMRHEALPVYRKLYEAAKDKDHPEALEYVDRRIRALIFRKKYAEGKWVPLLQDRTFSDWDQHYGNWTLDENGMLKGASASRDYGLLMVLKHSPGPRYELEGEIAPLRHGSIILGRAEEVNSRFMCVHVKKDRISLRSRFKYSANNPKKHYRKKYLNKFLIQVWDSKLTVYINGECIFFNRYIPETSWDPANGRIGIGGPFHKCVGYVVIFRNVRIRELTEPPVMKTGGTQPFIRDKREPDDIF